MKGWDKVKVLFEPHSPPLGQIVPLCPQPKPCSPGLTGSCGVLPPSLRAEGLFPNKSRCDSRINPKMSCSTKALPRQPNPEPRTQRMKTPSAERRERRGSCSSLSKAGELGGLSFRVMKFPTRPRTAPSNKHSSILRKTNMFFRASCLSNTFLFSSTTNPLIGG